MCRRVGNAQINRAMHKSQNRNHGFFCITLTIATRAIDILILNKKIPINQQTGDISHNNKNGRDNKRDQVHTFNHHHLSAKNQRKAFHISRQTTKLIVSNAQVFQE